MPMTQQEAQAALIDKHYVPEFVKRCAEHGMQLSDDQQLVTALTTAAQIKTIKAAQAGHGDLINKAAYALNAAQYGEDTAKQMSQPAAAQEKEAGNVEVDEETKEALAALFGQQ